MMTCHQVRQKYPATSAGKAANGSKSFATKIAKATCKVTSGIASVRKFRGTLPLLGTYAPNGVMKPQLKSRP